MGAVYSYNNQSLNEQGFGVAHGSNIFTPPPPVYNDIRRRTLAELSSMFAFPFGRVNAAPPPLHATTTVRCLVNLHKESLRLGHSEDISNDTHNDILIVNNEVVDVDNKAEDRVEQIIAKHVQYQLQFSFDSLRPCTVKIYFMTSAESVDDATCAYGPVTFPAGLDQTLLLPLEGSLSLLSQKPENLSFNPTTEVYPFIISIQCEEDRDDTLKRSGSVEPLKQDVHHQLTYATLMLCSDGLYVLKPVRQRIQYAGSMYGVHEVYGIDSGKGGLESSEGNRECVVCMTDARDTAVLPCRHMCLCHACAEMMRTQTNKCPICRAPVKALLKIALSGSSLPQSRKNSFCLTPLSSALPASRAPEPEPAVSGPPSSLPPSLDLAPAAPHFYAATINSHAHSGDGEDAEDDDEEAEEEEAEEEEEQLVNKRRPANAPSLLQSSSS